VACLAATPRSESQHADQMPADRRNAVTPRAPTLYLVKGASAVASSGKKIRLRAPLMWAFRNAAAARDASKRVDLRDESGERLIAGRRLAGPGAISESDLRVEVLRDLAMLLNTVNLASSQSLDDYPAAARAIINYGIPDIARRSIDEYGVRDIVTELETALCHFEPRLAKDTIKVSRDQTVRVEELKIRFQIRCDMIADPLNVPVEFLAEVQVDTGKITVGRG
jgi:type VI secretion system protein ImpF